MDFSEKRREWLKAKGALKNLELQRKKREMLEENIERLKNDKQEQELLDASIQKMRQLDHDIDHLEEFTEGRAEMLKNELIEMLLRERPEQKTAYLKWQQGINTANSLIKEGQEMEKILGQLLSSIKKMMSARQAVKKRGIFSYIFGQNPNILITQAILETKLLIEKKLPEIEQIAAVTSGGDLLREIYAEVIVFLSGLDTICKERWNFKRIDTIFAKSEKKLEMFLNAFEALEVEQKTTADSLKDKIDRWLIEA